jgi:ribosomal-protein-alanine N-acetyltransferase
MQTETARLRLRPFARGDFGDLCQLFADPDVMRYIGKGVRSAAETEETLFRMTAHWLQLRYGMWAVHEKATGAFVGRCGLQPLADKEEVELGYTFHRAFWGRGLATEASHAALRFGFGSHGLFRIVAIARPENLASWRVMEKLGMTFERKGPSPYDGSEVVWYALWRGDYEKLQKAAVPGLSH